MAISKKILILAFLTISPSITYTEDQNTQQQEPNSLYEKYASTVKPLCTPEGLIVVGATSALLGAPVLVAIGTAVIAYEKRDDIIAGLEPYSTPAAAGLKQFSKDFRKHNENKPVIASLYQGSDWIVANIEQLAKNFEEHKKQLKEKLEQSEK